MASRHSVRRAKGRDFDQITHKLRSDLPVLVLCSVFGLICVLGYIRLRTSLDHNAENRMNAYNDVVKMAPRAANHPSISGPFDTGWGYSDFGGAGLSERIGLPALPGQTTKLVP